MKGGRGLFHFKAERVMPLIWPVTTCCIAARFSVANGAQRT